MKWKFHIIHDLGGARLALWYNHSLSLPCPSFKSWGWGGGGGGGREFMWVEGYKGLSFDFLVFSPS